METETVVKVKREFVQRKLNADQVKQIRGYLERGEFSGQKLAKMFSVSPMTISLIKRGLAWKNV